VACFMGGTGGWRGWDMSEPGHRFSLRLALILNGKF
jgi:hypothetical protein